MAAKVSNKSSERGGKASTTKSKTKLSKAPQDKNDIIVDSDGDAAAPAITTTKRSAKSNSTSSSSSISSDSDSDEESSALKDTRALQSNNESSDESSVVSSSEDDEHREAAIASSAGEAESAKAAVPPTNTPSAVSGPRRAIHYKPPEGYRYIPIRDTPPILAAPAVDGKQIWHITAPANVPISGLTQITLDSIRQSTVVLSHAGTSYALAEDKYANAHLLLPSSQAAGYVAVDTPFTKTLHLRQHVKLPHLTSLQADPTAGAQAAAQIDQTSVARVKAQPAGLRMRYKPPGFGAGRPGTIGSDSENESDQNLESYKGQNRATKRKADGHGRPAQESPHKAKAAKIDDASSAGVAGDEHRLEKAARKEERRLKREAKEARRQSRLAV